VLGTKTSQDGVDRARAFARRAVELDPKLADAHWALGQVLMCFDRNLRSADLEYESAIALDPGHVDARHLHGVSLLAQCRYEEALGEVQQAIAVDPLLAEAHATAGRTYISMRQPERAMGFLRNTVDLAPDFVFARMYLAQALLQLGRHDEALTELRRAAATGSPRASAQLAYGYAVIGQRDRAREVLRELTDTSGAGSAAAFNVAIAYAALEDNDAALDWLDRAANVLDPWITAVNSELAFDGLRDDPRYGQLVRRLGL
jgi:tetratricopeptide (TPR) repeat protein